MMNSDFQSKLINGNHKENLQNKYSSFDYEYNNKQDLSNSSNSNNEKNKTPQENGENREEIDKIENAVDSERLDLTDPLHSQIYLNAENNFSRTPIRNKYSNEKL